MYNYTYTTTTTTSTLSPAATMGIVAVSLVLAIIAIVAMWKVFTKANRAGWMSIIPVLNLYVLIRIAGRPGWWILLYFIPFVNIITSAVIAVDVAKSFGKSVTFGIVGLWLFQIIGYLMLGFGSATYVGPAAASGSSSTPATA